MDGPFGRPFVDVHECPGTFVLGSRSANRSVFVSTFSLERDSRFDNCSFGFFRVGLIELFKKENF